MKSEQQILERYINNHTSDALSAIENLEEEEIVLFIESLPVEWGALLLSQMDRSKAAQSLEKIKLEMAVELIENLPVTIALILLRSISTDICKTILDALPAKISQHLRRLMSYSKNTVGAFLNPIAFTVFKEMTVKQVQEVIKKKKPQLQSHLFVIDRNQVLVGFIDLKELIAAGGNKSIQSIMNSNPPRITAKMSILALNDDEAWKESFSDLPVVDNDGFFLGIVSKEILKELNPETKAFDHIVYKTATALGDLYKIGLVSLLRNISEIPVKQNPE